MCGHQLLIFFSVIGRISVVAERLQEITAYIDLAPVYIEIS